MRIAVVTDVMGSLKEILRSSASRALVGTGVCALGRRLFPRAGTLIFYGHRVAADDDGYLEGLRPEWLDEQLTYLTRHYEIIPLSTLVRCYEERRPVPDRSAVITFDDGFRDNLVNGLPILKRHGVPATIFVVTGCATSGELPWPQRLGYLFQHTRAKSFVAGGGAGPEVSLESEAGRRAAYLSAKDALLAAPRGQREAELERLARTLAVESPKDRMLSWAELEALTGEGIELGAHTYSHPWLARIPAEEARWEMERCRADLRERLGIEHPSFCFPAGSHDAALMGLVRTLGFRSAFQPSPRHRYNTLENAHAFGLGRLGLPNAPAVLLEAELDGPFPALRRLGGKLRGRR
jgi:peptidoglycan/xylan/chitin deacetylase (PgdA/CDA1 family)